jgi:transcriptional regulator with XRE-family HTH domain
MLVNGGPRGGFSEDEAAYLRRLGECLRLVRLARRLSQVQLARASGVSRNSISSIERGAHCSDVLRLARLAAALGQPTATFFDAAERQAPAVLGQRNGVGPHALEAVQVSADQVALRSLP